MQKIFKVFCQHLESGPDLRDKEDSPVDCKLFFACIFMSEISFRVKELLQDEDVMTLVVATVERVLAERAKDDALLTREQVARRLNVSKQTIWRWEGLRLHVVRQGKRCLYRESDVRKLEGK